MKKIQNMSLFNRINDLNQFSKENKEKKSEFFGTFNSKLSND